MKPRNPVRHPLLVAAASLALAPSLRAEPPKGTSSEAGTWIKLVWMEGAEREIYDGFVEKQALARLLRGEETGFVKLDHVFWKMNDGVHYQAEDSTKGRGPHTFVRASSVITVYPLAEGFVREAFSEAELARAAMRRSTVTRDKVLVPQPVQVVPQFAPRAR